MHSVLAMHVLLVIHIAAGFAAFLLAPVALVTAKGGKQHKRWGKAYLWAMGIIAATALPMATYRPVLFLALVAVFSFYLAFSGYRILRLKDLARGGRAKAIDWIAAAVTFADGCLLLYLGAFHPQSIQVIGIVGIIFGLIAVQAPVSQVITFIRKPKEKMFWLFSHLQGFLASYIAAWTAFSVVTLTQVLGNHWYVWLWPTIVGIPGIVMTAAYYERKFAPRARTAT
jgi:uncharacterized membrane protein